MWRWNCLPYSVPSVIFCRRLVVLGMVTILIVQPLILLVFLEYLIISRVLLNLTTVCA